MSLNYSNYKKDEILRLEDPSKLFSILIDLDWKGHEANWYDIFSGLRFYYANKEYLDRQLPTHLTDKHIALLEDKFGFDINYVDGFGNNLLLFATSVVDSPTSSSAQKYYFDYCIDYIRSNTKNVYHINKANENLLFKYTSYSTVGSKAEKLKKLMLDYPDFDLSLVNNYGNNLLANAILQRSPTEVIQTYYDLKVSPLQINNKGLSILSYITYGFAEGVYLDIFKDTISNLDNPFVKSESSVSFLDYLMDRNKEVLPDWQLSTWLAASLNEITQNNYKLNKDTKDYLESFFSEGHIVQAQDFYDKARASFYKRVLESELANDSFGKNLQNKKNKL